MKRLANEHGVANDGTCDAPAHDRRDVFFRHSEGGRCVPRALLFDLEAKVLEGIKRQEWGGMYGPENFWTSPEGAGAGNNWASGFSQAESKEEELFNIIDREAEKADSMDVSCSSDTYWTKGFVLIHSIAGGTGSGMGSFLLESLNDRYKKKLIQTYSVFPVCDLISFVTLLFLAIDIRCCSATLQLCFDSEETCSECRRCGRLHWNQKKIDVLGCSG